jgi:hypothetical protein
LKQNLNSLVSCYPENVTKGHTNFVHFSQYASNRGRGKGFYSSPKRPGRTLERKEPFPVGKQQEGDADHLLHLLPRIRTCRALSAVPHIFS